MDLTELGKKPISEANPAGDDIRYEPEFEELQQQIDKLSIASAGGTGIDWNRVIALSGTILETKSKNIQVATYLAAGLIETNQFQGLVDGLAVIKDLVENFWDTMYPPLKRLRGRFNAVAWWADRAETFLNGFDPDPLPPELVTGAQSNLSDLDRMLSEKSDDAPILSRVQGLIERLPVQAPAAEADTQAPQAPQAGQAPTVQPRPASPAPTVSASGSGQSEASDLASDQDASAMLDSGLTRLLKASDYYMQKDLSNSLPYRLNRIAAWLTVDQLPMSDKGITPLPAPDSMIRSAIEGLVSSRDYEGAVRACEARVGEYLFWLDMSRISAQALDALGGRYQAAQDMLAMETAGYAKRLPGLENLCFSDGTPFADPETKAWLASISQSGDGGGAGMSGGEAASQVTDGFNKALELIKGKKVGEAVGLLEDHFAHSASGRERLLWRNAMVRLLIRAGRPELALPHAKAILTDIDGHHLETWDPALALDGLVVIHQSMSMAGNETSATNLDDITARIARISPKQALNLSSG